MTEEKSSASVGETPEIKLLCEEWKNLNPKAVALKTRMDYLKKKIVELSGGNPVLSAGVSVKTTSRKGNIDYSQIKGIQKMTEDGSIEKYRKKSSRVTKISVVG